MKLVVVESPAKAKTIEKYLGPGHTVLASFGHVRDLPPKDGSVNPDDGFAMLWDTYADKARQLKAITDVAKTADTLILATDPDREGEAISWHVQEVLAKKKLLPKDVQRVTFNAITKPAVLEAMANPRALDEDLIDAYRARRALDYLVGFTLSPVLWRKLPGAKSAGRVQSVCLRLVVDREREIEAFKPQEYWSVIANMEHDGVPFIARLVRHKGEKIERLTIGSAGAAAEAKAAVEAGRFSVATVETKPLTRNPPPPFTTSTLQQATQCESRRICMRMARSLICAPMAFRWMAAPFPPRAGPSPTVLMAAMCQTSRANIPPRPRMRRKRMKRSARPISARTGSAVATMPSFMISSGSARWRARWHPPG